MKNTKFHFLTENPIFFERNRVYRITMGGKLFHDFFGDEPVDSNFPEEWIASDVKASLNKSFDEYDGISKIKGTNIYFNELLQAEPDRMTGGRKELGVLVKALDSSMRLPVQVHPDRLFSKKYLSSNFGKVEAWLILATRGNAEINFGFKEKIDSKMFTEAIRKNETDKNALADIMHKIPVKPGDVFLIPAGYAHAIGAGILLVEFQEPTDFTISPEFWCGNNHIPENMKYLGLDRDLALSCFDYSAYGKQAEMRGRILPQKLAATDQYSSECLISFRDTPCFCVNRHKIFKFFSLPHAPAVILVTEGSGMLITENSGKTQEQPLHRGDYFFLPYALAGASSIAAGKNTVEIIECLPPGNI